MRGSKRHVAEEGAIGIFFQVLIYVGSRCVGNRIGVIKVLPEVQRFRFLFLVTSE